MATFIVGFDGKWQEKFRDQQEAVTWAEEVAETGRTVEVVRRRFGVYRFVTGFPESERVALKANRGVPYLGGSGGIYG
jgi:hypothetical protein